MLKFYFSGADGVVAVPETLTSGMVGKKVGFSFSEDWDGLSKVAVFSSGRVSRDVVLDRDVLIIPPEVLRVPMRNLYVGVYGVSADGSLVIPTIRVKGPFIEAGTDPSGDPSLEPELPVWSKLLASIGDLSKLDTQTGDTVVGAINELVAMVKNQPAIGDLNELATKAKNTLVDAINELVSKSGTGLTETEKSLMLTLYRKSVYNSDASEAFSQLNTLWGGENEVPNPHVHSFTAKITAEATCTTPGVCTYTCSCGESYTVAIPAKGHNFVDGVCSNCGAADPDYEEEIQLVSITAVYSGGEVPVGTDVSALTGIVITAQYSDGSTKTVTDYTLSGTIAEGSNTITASYGGMTATFTVTGVAEEEEVTFYTITNVLTNVTSSNSVTSVEKDAAYTATLTAASGYNLNTVTVTMGSENVTAAVYADGVVTISNVTGDVIITASALPAMGELLYNWDLTTSLTDTIGGLTATLGGSATQDENGLTISGANGSCYFGSEVFVHGGVLEIDVASANFKNAGVNGFFVMNRTKNDAANGIGNAGITYRTTGQWQYYYYAWKDPNTVLTDPNAIAGKTIRYVSHKDHRGFNVYIGDALLNSISTAGIEGDHSTMLQIGSSSTAYFDLVVTAVRVYKGEA